MSNYIDFDKFLDIKQKPGLRVFVLLLEKEHPYMDSDSNWIRFLKEEVYVVRLTAEEFQMLDVGIHPKVIFFYNGKETAEFNGVPSMQKMKSLLKEYS